MICLDTNVISEIAKPTPQTAFVKWMKRQAPDAMFIPGPVIMEVAYGAEKAFLRSGTMRYRHFLEKVVFGRFGDRIADFSGEALSLCGHLRARRERSGTPISTVDAMIAAICIANGATLATRNVQDFEGLDLDLVNPFEAS